jgi:hypothetical protein
MIQYVAGFLFTAIISRPTVSKINNLVMKLTRMKNEIAEELIRWFSSAVSRHSRYHIADDPSLKVDHAKMNVK